MTVDPSHRDLSAAGLPGPSDGAAVSPLDEVSVSTPLDFRADYRSGRELVNRAAALQVAELTTLDGQLLDEAQARGRAHRNLDLAIEQAAGPAQRRALEVAQHGMEAQRLDLLARRECVRAVLAELLDTDAAGGVFSALREAPPTRAQAARNADMVRLQREVADRLSAYVSADARAAAQVDSATGRIPQADEEALNEARDALDQAIYRFDCRALDNQRYLALAEARTLWGRREVTTHSIGRTDSLQLLSQIDWLGTVTLQTRLECAHLADRMLACYYLEAERYPWDAVHPSKIHSGSTEEEATQRVRLLAAARSLASAWNLIAPQLLDDDAPQRPLLEEIRGTLQACADRLRALVQIQVAFAEGDVPEPYARDGRLQGSRASVAYASEIGVPDRLFEFLFYGFEEAMTRSSLALYPGAQGLSIRARQAREAGLHELAEHLSDAAHFLGREGESEAVTARQDLLAATRTFCYAHPNLEALETRIEIAASIINDAPRSLFTDSRLPPHDGPQ